MGDPELPDYGEQIKLRKSCNSGQFSHPQHPSAPTRKKLTVKHLFTGAPRECYRQQKLAAVMALDRFLMVAALHSRPSHSSAAISALAEMVRLS